jgi:dTDP-4-dehydrorhamnose 3,5-epimerase-like enzyme
MHEEILNIISHKGNANQNCIEISSTPSQKGYHQENKQQMLVRIWGGKNFICVQENVN